MARDRLNGHKGHDRPRRGGCSDIVVGMGSRGMIGQGDGYSDIVVGMGMNPIRSSGRNLLRKAILKCFSLWETHGNQQTEKIRNAHRGSLRRGRSSRPGAGRSGYFDNIVRQNPCPGAVLSGYFDNIVRLNPCPGAVLSGYFDNMCG